MGGGGLQIWDIAFWKSSGHSDPDYPCSPSLSLRMADEVSEEQLKQLAIDEKDDESSKYKAPAEKSIAELQQLDADDEALRRYKESLLGTHLITILFFQK